MATTAREEFLLRSEIVTFKKFLAENNIGEEAAVVPLLRQAWNQASASTANYANIIGGGEAGYIASRALIAK